MEQDTHPWPVSDHTYKTGAGPLRTGAPFLPQRQRTLPRSIERPSSAPPPAPSNVPSRLAEHASELYARNLLAMLGVLIDQGAIRMDPADEIVAAMRVATEGVNNHAPASPLIAFKGGKA